MIVLRLGLRGDQLRNALQRKTLLGERVGLGEVYRDRAALFPAQASGAVSVVSVRFRGLV